MLGWITQTLMNRELDNPKIVIEAGTGTGKTVGYLISALFCARELGKTVIASTATISLQNQLLNKDIPQLIECGAIDVQARLAKGRRRYLCPIRLEQAVSDPQGQYDDERLFQPTHHQLGTLKGFYEEFHSGKWDGDLDGWDDSIDSDLIPMVTTDHAGCRGRQCEAIMDCPFFNARDQLDDAEIIVTNHDLVLSDLALGGGVVLPAPEDAIYIFDEAHHLAEKAITHQNANLQLGASRRWLDGLEKALKSLDTTTELDATLRRVRALIPDYSAQLSTVEDHIRLLIQQLEGESRWSTTAAKTPLLRLPPEPLPEPLRQTCSDALTLGKNLKGELSQLVDWLKNDAEKPDGQLDTEIARHQQSYFNKACVRLDGAIQLTQHYSQMNDAGPEARWIRMDGIEAKHQWRDCDPDLWFSPASAGPGLERALWSRCAGAVLCSATLAVGGRFDQVYQALGLDSSSPCQVIGARSTMRRRG